MQTIYAKGGGGGGLAGRINRTIGPVAGRRAQTRLRSAIVERARQAGVARARAARGR
jgi:hypothetical protein